LRANSIGAIINLIHKISQLLVGKYGRSLKYLPLGGSCICYKKKHASYEYKDQVLIIDCGLGFADETMVGGRSYVARRFAIFQKNPNKKKK